MRYYSRLFEENGLKVSDIQDIDDLRKLPYLEKDTIRKHADEFVPVNSHKKLLIRASTSGTTGTPLRLYRTCNSIVQEHAYLWRQFSWAGCRPGDKTVALRGDMVVPSSQHNPPFWRNSVFENTLLMSSFHLSENTIPLYLAKLEQYEPVLIYAYPSAIYLLADFLVRNKVDCKLPSLRGVVTSSETLFPFQRATIERGMGCKVFDWYGLAERVVFIGTCEHASYHVFDDYGITEFIPISDNRYELVGTGLINLGMPLIRYKTGDIVEIADQEQCACGRAFRMVRSIEGRKDDMIKLKSGKMLGRIDHIFKGLEGIVEAQVVQQTIDNILIRLVVDRSFDKSTLKKVETNARERFGNEVGLATKIVREIPRTPNGKFKTVVSLVD